MFFSKELMSSYFFFVCSPSVEHIIMTNNANIYTVLSGALKQNIIYKLSLSIFFTARPDLVL